MAIAKTTQKLSNLQSTSSSLREMGIYLLRAMDATKKRIAKIEETTAGGTITYIDGATATVQIAAKFDSALLCNGFVIVENSRENVQAVIDCWKEAITFEKLTILFLDVNTGNKWIIRPHIHEKIAEPKTLAQGLLSLHEQSNARA